MKLLKSYRTFGFAVFVALFLWLYVKSSSRFQQTIQVPVELINVKEGFGVVSDVPQAVPVLFEADGRTLLALKYIYDIRFKLDLAQVKDDQVIVFGESLKSVSIPDNVPARVVAVSSSDTVIIRYEKMVEKRVPIYPNVTVSCRPGYVMVGPVHVAPESLTVSCPRSVADSVTSLGTAAILVEDLAKDKVMSIPLGVIPTSRLSFVPTDIEVRIDIQPLGEMVVDNLPVRLINVPDGVNAVVQPSTFSIRLRGGIDFLSTLSRDSILAVIDFSEEERLNRVIPQVDILAPSDVKWSQITPARFNIVRLNDTLTP